MNPDTGDGAPEPVSARQGGTPRLLVYLGMLLLCWSLLLFGGLTRLGFLDNEGRYAEVAREMLLTGDWITPHLNGERFLNKPPLLFWLAALWFRCVHMDETVRVVPGLVALSTAVVLYLLGARLWRPTAGGWAAAVFLTATLTLSEARTLRPDGLFSAALCLSILGAVQTLQDGATPATRLRGAVVLWIGIALGVMTKGLAALLLPWLIVVPALFLAARPTAPSLRAACVETMRQVPVLLPWQAWVLGALLAVPWHVAAGLANPGFWWDYVVNQHLLFFFDRKFPRDSKPDPLWYVWALFLGRFFPWTFLLPAALWREWHAACRERTPIVWLPLAWAAAVWVLFSLSRGHLEHYFIPAVPPCALMVGAWCDAACRRRELPGRARELIPFLLLVGVAAAGGATVPGVLRATGYAALVPASGWLSSLCFAGLLLGGAAGGLAMHQGRRSAALGWFALTALAVQSLAEESRVRSGPLLSPRELIRRLPPDLVRDSVPVYEAGEEYQLCGVLNFYLRSRMLLPEPPGFIPPTYLAQDVGRLFVPRREFSADWARGRRRYLLITNPEEDLGRPDAFPQPIYEVDRDGKRQVLTNLPVRKKFSGDTKQAPGLGR